MYAAIAQLVEQGTENPCVLGSIPSCGTILKRPQRGLFFIAKNNDGIELNLTCFKSYISVLKILKILIV